ncbi:excinuclease ABC subunit A [Enterococcus canis]|uniref:UvrABC system protein A n=1 Tax=Enterococcus canis TaxID=214095 RepID=A0A1L8RK80_9ENTE|nr:excinuclease ABC subunit UvrA [Enterococcus canis]OJG20124.1 excinuclease ABC subunit A [Enterococcus canis]
MNEMIRIQHARENNLKDVSVTIPKHALTVVTGLSGSGKSSLVFDTLAAESRRELNETFPSFLQQYLPKYGRPDVEAIENLPVGIIVDQKKLSDNARSTVGTYTDIYTYLRLLFSRFGQPNIGYSDVFSFNHPEGKCPTCDGLGYVTTIDVHKLVDFNKSLNEDAIDFPTFHTGFWRWKRYADSGLFDLDKKIKDYTPEELQLFLYSPQMKLKNPPAAWPHTAQYEGLIPRIQRSILHRDEGKRHQKQLDKFVTTETCPDCQGTRVNPRVRSCKINGKSIADVVLLPLDEVGLFLQNIEAENAKEIRRAAGERVQSLIDIGLGYLDLARGTGSLSGGEAQRIKISKYITSALTDVLYLLDEPSVGLHPKDIDQLKQAIRRLKDTGNTVILVEHHPELIKIADYVIDMGPGAGLSGGEVLFHGSYQDFLKSDSVTSRWLQKRLPMKKAFRQATDWLPLTHLHRHNLKDISLQLPLGVLTVLCGVAGSGKSLLMAEIQHELSDKVEVVAISQKNIGINIRSTALTYLGVFDQIRKLFSQATGLSPAYFSYNSKGACPHCHGKGVIVADMSFMDDIVTVCEVCHGTRYDPKMRDYQLNGRSIIDVLAMSVTEAQEFFDQAQITRALEQVTLVGLGYIVLNQSLSTLSGGELQRLKLASQLQKQGAVYLLDEPTDGLHLSDVQVLLRLFEQLVAQGNTLVLSEHHLEVMKQADWLIELGPAGGEKGGQLLFTGTPADLLASDDQITAPYLRE